MQEETKSYVKVSETEYQLMLDGSYKTIYCPFGKTELLFKTFIANGGIIDPSTGEVQTDIISLISSFKEIGNILLSEFDESGKCVTNVSCVGIAPTSVVALFMLATVIIEDFTLTLAQINQRKSQPPKM